MTDPANPPPQGVSPQDLRWLKALVMTMTIIMIVGFLIIVATLVMRLTADPLPLPDRVSLPEGASAVSYAEGPDFIAVVTDQDQILIFRRTTGTLRQTIEILPETP